jgi:hypothetical protein
MASGRSLHIGLDYVSTNTFPHDFYAPGCAAAASRMRDLAAALGYSESILRCNEHARFATIQSDFRSLTGRLNDGDIFLLTLAGHGRRTVLDNGSLGSCFFLYNHYWRDDEIHELLAEIDVRARVFIVADACMSGALVTCARGGLTPNTLLLAASPADRLALAAQYPDELPPFSRALLHVSGHSSDYGVLRKNIERIVVPQGNPIPVLNEQLAGACSFRAQKPFSI